MGSLMLVNPKRKRRSKRKLSPAQKAAGFGGGRRRKRARRSRANLHVNPRRRRSTSGKRRRRLHRNPRRASARGIAGKGMSFLKGSLMPAALGGAGALAIDVAWAMAPIPIGIKSGPAAPLVKIAGAVAIGAAVSKFANKQFGQAMVAGYLTVLAYNTIRGFVTKAMPTLPLAGYPYDLGYMQSGQFLPDETGISAYLGAPEGYGVVDDSGGEGVGAYMNGYGDDVS